MFAIGVCAVGIFPNVGLVLDANRSGVGTSTDVALVGVRAGYACTGAVVVEIDARALW